MTCGLDGNILRTEYNKSRDSPSALSGVSGSNPADHRDNYVSRSHLGINRTDAYYILIITSSILSIHAFVSRPAYPYSTSYISPSFTITVLYSPTATACDDFALNQIKSVRKILFQSVKSSPSPVRKLSSSL